MNQAAARLAFGEHLIMGIEGSNTLTELDRALLREFKPVGILFLGRNFAHGSPYAGWFKDFTRLIDEIRSLTGRSQLLLSIDHEGAQWVRTPAPITRFPTAALYKERSFEVGKATAQELASLGLNVSWAPICDVHSNPANPIIGPRAFGTTAETAGRYAREYYLGLRAGGVEGCAKHFPGHGDTVADSHLELPRVEVSQSEMVAREIAAFRPVLSEGVPFVMTAHVLFPKIDPEREATRSSFFLQDILRNECGFKGVVVSDDLEMKAVSTKFHEPQSLLQACEAGCDMFIVSRFAIKDRSFLDFLADNFGKVCPEPIVTPARERIHRVVSLLPSNTSQQLPRSVFEHHLAIALDVAGL